MGEGNLYFWNLNSWMIAGLQKEELQIAGDLTFILRQYRRHPENSKRKYKCYRMSSMSQEELRRALFTNTFPSSLALLNKSSSVWMRD